MRRSVDRITATSLPLPASHVTSSFLLSSSRVRGAAAGAIAQLLNRSQRLLSMPSSASGSFAPSSTRPVRSNLSKGDSHSSFAPLSQRMGRAATETYEVISTAALRERNPTTLAQIIRCASALVANAPPPAVPQRVVTPLLGQLRRLAFDSSTDATVRSGAVSCIATLFASAHPNVPYLKAALGRKKHQIKSKNGGRPSSCWMSVPTREMRTKRQQGTQWRFSLALLWI